MNPVLVTQRRDFFAHRSEIRDSLDISLYSLLQQLGLLPIPLPSIHSMLHNYIDTIRPSAIILSGGNDLGTCIERDNLEALLLTFALNNSIPVVGLCRGMQFINYFQGGSQRRVSSHAGTRHKLLGPLSTTYISPVNSFHNFGITHNDLGASLEPLAWSDDGVIEAFRHSYLPWLGIMWHPERENPFLTSDLELLYKHLFL